MPTSPRLPVPGSDDGTWGDVLNSFLQVSHNADGTLQSSALSGAGVVTSVNTKTPASGNITLNMADIADVQGGSGATDNQVLAYNSSTNKWVPNTVSGSSVSDATTSNKGIVQLAGDLAGTAVSPAIASGAVTGSKIANTTITDANIATSAAISRTKLDSSSQTSLGKADTALQSVADATTLAKGVVQLAGDLSGTAASPTVAAGAITSSKIANGTITDANLASGAAIARTKLDSSTQTSLGKADSALQSAPVSSVNSQTGAVSLNAGSVGAVATPPGGTADGSIAVVSSGAVTWQQPTSSGLQAVAESSGSYPNRPAGTGPVLFIGPDQPASGGTTSGGAGAVAGLDIWVKVAS